MGDPGAVGSTWAVIYIFPCVINFSFQLQECVFLLASFTTLPGKELLYLL